MEKKSARMALGWVLLTAVCVAPAWAKKKVGPESVWDPGASEVTALREMCAASDPAKTRSCFLGGMKTGGASREAQEFAAQIPEPAFMRSFADGGPVGVAYVTFPYRANENQGVFLVNGKPDLVNVDDPTLLPKADLEKDSIYAALKAKNPEATLWPGDRYSPGHPAVERTPGGGVHFLVDFRILNGCRACEEIGTAFFSFEFDEGGAFKGVSLARVEDGRNVRKSIQANAGLEFNIRLKADQSTGYRWIVKQPPDAAVLSFSWRLYNAPDPASPGSGGEEIWGFKAVGKGKTTMVLDYANPAKGAAEKAQEVTYDVTVQ